MRFQLLVGMLILGLALPARGAPLKVAVTDVRASNVEASVAENLTEVLASLLQKRGLVVISRADIVALLGFEQQKQLLKCEDDGSCMAQIGGALGVERLVSGTVGRVGKTYVLSLSLLDVQRARVVGRTSDTVTGDVDQLLATLQRALPDLLGQDPVFTRESAVRPATWLLAGAGVALVGGAVAAWLQHAAVTDLTNTFDRTGSYDNAIAGRARGLSYGANGLFIVGGLLAASGAVALAW